jgi:hypothetical protein
MIKPTPVTDFLARVLMTTGARSEFDPVLLAVLSNRFESIIREMTNTVMKASRSSVIKNARDMSCGILTYDHRLVSVEEALPIHVTALELTTKPITELFDDIKDGDAFINNSPFYGGTHHADLTLCVPVFWEGAPLFWTLARSHHADMGAPEPTTYLPYASTIYQEGLHFPCIRIQEEGKDKADQVWRCDHQGLHRGVDGLWRAASDRGHPQAACRHLLLPGLPRSSSEGRGRRNPHQGHRYHRPRRRPDHRRCARQPGLCARRAQSV